MIAGIVNANVVLKACDHELASSRHGMVLPHYLWFVAGVFRLSVDFWRMARARRKIQRWQISGGEQFRFPSGSIGWRLFPVNYGNCLFVTVSQDGFALAIFLLIRFMHPRVVIPWSAVERCEPVKFRLVNYIAVYISGFNRRLLLSGSLGKKILDTWARERKAL